MKKNKFFSQLFQSMNLYHWLISVITLVAIIGGGVTFANKIPYLEESVVALEGTQEDMQETVYRMDERLKSMEEDLDRLVDRILGDE